jgi:hypothetical protein
MRELDDPPQRLDLAIFPKATIFRRGPSLCCDGSGFDHTQPWATQDDAAHVREMPGCMVPVFGAVLA